MQTIPNAAMDTRDEWRACKHGCIVGTPACIVVASLEYTPKGVTAVSRPTAVDLNPEDEDELYSIVGELPESDVTYENSNSIPELEIIDTVAPKARVLETIARKITAQWEG